MLCFYLQVRIEDTDILVMLIHHGSMSNHPLMVVTSKGSYSIATIRDVLSEQQMKYLLTCHSFTGCDTVSAISGYGKSVLFTRLCTGGVEENMDVFLDLRTDQKKIISAGICIF